MDVGRVGIWTGQLDLQPAARAREVAAELDALGYGALWVPEAVGREVMSHAAVLLDATERLVVATGVASIFARVPPAAANAQRLLADASGGRFLLGLGVSHAPMVEGMLGQEWNRPVARMRAYLDGIDDTFTVSPAPAHDPPRVLAALGPAMLRLASAQSWGALTYFVPVEHTAFAREHLGGGPMLMVEQAAVLSIDAEAARRAARKHIGVYLTLPNYANNLRRLGWDDDDLAGGGSDALVDALVAWGDVDAVAARVAAHHDAGADHVCVQVLDEDVTALPLDAWRSLAPTLLPEPDVRKAKAAGKRRKAPTKSPATAKKAASAKVPTTTRKAPPRKTTATNAPPRKTTATKATARKAPITATARKPARKR
jgi:probable F420-dependent oxidoreductase